MAFQKSVMETNKSGLNFKTRPQEGARKPHNAQ